MFYPQDIESKIEFTAVRDLLRSRCSFAVSREEADALSVITDFNVLQLLLREAHEMLSVITDASLPMPHVEWFDMRESLSRIRVEGLFLDEPEVVCLGKLVDAVALWEDFFASLPVERFSALRGYKADMAEPLPAKAVRQSIDSIIDKYGSLRDDASPEMARIRRELRLSQGAAERALASILRQVQAEGIVGADVTPTLREGRLVIPLPPSYKRKLGGIVHDESATGKTVYVEPQQVVEANNRIRELEGEEKRERIRILRDFAAIVRPILPALGEALIWLGHVDFIIAKARLARDLKAIAPEIRNEPIVDLREARHPLLYLNFKNQNKEVVPLTLKLNTDNRVLIISGPNAGGKSVCIKTVALLQYMLQCGLLIPVREDTVCGIFDSIFIDIGDDQSLDDDLSTYSSHLRNMKAFLHNTDEHSLFFIDEFGGGTEPLLGGAIAEAVLTALCKTGAFGLVTTHYTNLKHFADSHNGVLNGAMLYDRGAMRPLFQLSVGQPGSSFAIEIAEQTGLPREVVNHARELIGDDTLKIERNLQEIARDKRYWADKRRVIHDKEKQLEELVKRYELQMADVNRTKKDILRKAKEDAVDLLDRSNRTIENTIRQIKEAKAEKEQTRKARQHIENLKTALIERKPKQAPKDVNQESSASVSEKPATKNNKRVFNDFSQLSQLAKSVAKEDTTPVPSRPAAPAGLTTGSRIMMNSSYVRDRRLSFSRELDVRGMRADEAVQEVMAYIDDAVMLSVGEVRILHGTGSGILKKLIRDYLGEQSRVISYGDGDPNHGGAGITVVNL